MEDENVQFEEDKSILSPLNPEEIVPKSGFEGWFYRTFPGTYKFKKVVLIIFILLMFIIALVFFVMARYNTITTNNSESFSDKILNTKLK